MGCTSLERVNNYPSYYEQMNQAELCILYNHYKVNDEFKLNYSGAVAV